MRRGFKKEVDAVFRDAQSMAGAGHPEEIDAVRKEIEALRKELWRLIKTLKDAEERA